MTIQEGDHPCPDHVRSLLAASAVIWLDWSDKAGVTLGEGRDMVYLVAKLLHDGNSEDQAARQEKR